MKLRHNKGLRPQITFTSDFHQLVQGDFTPALGPCECVLRYDPLRLIDATDAETQARTVSAHIRFHPSMTVWEGRMVVPAGSPLAQLAHPAGQGIMLQSSFTLPEGTQELEAWFSCQHPDGHVHWDSASGQNYWLRFSIQDLTIQTSKIKKTKKSEPLDLLLFEVVSTAPVDHLEVRWRLTNQPILPRVTSALVGEMGPDGSKKWLPSGKGIPVPKDATIAYDLVYYIEGRKFTDDNQGRWYLAD